jgi:sialate O-acetylesterase
MATHNLSPNPMFPSPGSWPRIRPWSLALLSGLGLLPLRADVRLPAIFGDHMVLQQEAALPVWGWADPGERVTVTFAGEMAQTVAGADGRWRTDLTPLAGGTPPNTLTVTGKNTVTLQDVLVGEVWLCSGQSNMEFKLTQADNGEAEILQASDGEIRLFLVARAMALAPRSDVTAHWQVCSPATVGNFSAVGYFFGKNLRAALHRPVGLIDSTWGATPAQSWTDLATLERDPLLRHYAQAFQKIAARFPGGDAEFAANAVVRAAEHPQPPPPGAPRPAWAAPQKTPTLLFNGMIAPLIPFAIRGAIWYQAEDNAENEARGSSFEYRTLFPALITDWRTQWRQGDFPFLFVQLPNLAVRPKADWPLVRESQLKTLALPQTGMAVSIDIGTAGFIHPPDKADVGYRLALAARHVAYGEKLVYAGPVFAGMKADGSQVRISFQPDSIGGGLIIGTTPWLDPKGTPIPTTRLLGFALAGPDRQWAPANAQIDGDTVVLSSPAVPNPVAVRYAWADNPACNLYNREGLPASPFRTDEWDEPSLRAPVGQ